MATRKASTSSGLLNALKAASNGDVINLAAGTYSVSIANIDKSVTITSSSAVFSKLVVNKSSKLTFDGIDFNAPDGASKPFQIQSSDRITIRNGDMEGVAKGTGAGNGLWVSGGSSDITVQNMAIHGFDTGIWVGSIDGLVIRNNKIRNIATDGIIAGNLHDAVISGNTIDLAAPSGRKHSDGIQFYNIAKGAASTHVTISDNVILTHNNLSHGIYGQNEYANGGGGKAAFFQNVTIRDNWVISGDGFGISWGRTNHLDITGNIVMKDRHLLPEKSVPSIRVAWQSTDVDITHNVVEKKSVPADAAWQTASKTGSNWEISDKIVPVGTTLDGARAALASLKGAPAAAPGADADGDVFRFEPHIGARDWVRADFDAGDTVVLSGYERGTFSGAFASGNGSAVTIDSLAHLKAIDKASAALTTFEAKNDAISLVIHQDEGNHQVRLIGLAHEFF